MNKSNLHDDPWFKISNDDLQKLKNGEKNYQKEFAIIFKKDFKNRDDLIEKWFTSLIDQEKEVIVHSYGLQGEQSKEDSIIARIMNISEKIIKDKFWNFFTPQISEF